MIHPNMATLLGFLTTDANVTPAYLKKSLQEAAAVSFNMISVDGDTSPSDTLLILANGMAKTETNYRQEFSCGYFPAGSKSGLYLPGQSNCP